MTVQGGIPVWDPLRPGNRPDMPVGNTSIQPSRLRVVGPYGEERVEPKVMAVLLLLVDAEGAVVTRDELHEFIWKGVPVGDDALNRAIAEARRAARGAGADFTIETVPRVGYSLHPSAEATGPAETDEEPATPATATGGLGNLNRRTLLGGATALAVIGGFAAWHFGGRQASQAEALGKEALDIIRAEYSPTGRNPVDLLRQAVRLEPGNARLLGLLAFALGAAMPKTPAAAAEADGVARRALAIEPGEPYASLALANLRAGLIDWISTERAYRDILSRDPDNIEVLGELGFMLQGLGRVLESWKFLEHAAAVDPMVAGPQYKRAIKLWVIGRVAESDRVADRAMSLWPFHPWVWNARLMTYMFSHREGAARRMLADTDKHPEAIAAPAIATWQAGLAALEQPTAATIDTARTAYFRAAPRAPGLAAHGIMTMSALGEVDAAYSLIDMLVFNAGPLVQPVAQDKSRKLLSDAEWRQTQWLFTPPLGAVREDPRFPALCERLGLTEYWQRIGAKADPVRSFSVLAPSSR